MGSEMCIRDRAIEPARSPHMRLVLPHVDIGVERALEQRGNGEICLLYTSDAADERSSVDLGGRRIIKKKKIKQQNATVQSLTQKRTM